MSTTTPIIIALAPMEGLVDPPMREVITAMGGMDWCVTEFVRVTQTLLPVKLWRRVAPESDHQWRTASGTPIHAQLLGSDPHYLALNAARAVALGSREIDLNFGCPAKTVNRHRGGSVLLEEPELLEAIVAAVRAAVPAGVPVTAKMRLGYRDKTNMEVCARALENGGAARIVVHARTKVEGYRPPAHWHCIARIREAVSVPVIANGDIWTVEDYWQCRRESGCADVMLGRGVISRPDLARQIRAAADGRAITPLRWSDLREPVQHFYATVTAELAPKAAAGRIKNWLSYLARSYPGAARMLLQVRGQPVIPDLPDEWFNDDDEGQGSERFMPRHYGGFSDAASHPANG
jgi:tRNA-dihydrouridine synthase C